MIKMEKMINKFLIMLAIHHFNSTSFSREDYIKFLEELKDKGVNNESKRDE